MIYGPTLGYVGSHGFRESLLPVRAQTQGPGHQFMDAVVTCGGSPMSAGRVSIPVPNTRGQTGSVETRARSRLPASRKAVAKKVRQSGQEAVIEQPACYCRVHQFMREAALKVEARGMITSTRGRACVEALAGQCGLPRASRSNVRPSLTRSSLAFPRQPCPFRRAFYSVARRVSDHDWPRTAPERPLPAFRDHPHSVSR